MTTAGEAALRRVLAVFDLLIDAVDEDTLVPALLPLLLRAVPGDSIVWAPQAAPAGREPPAAQPLPLCLPGGLLGPDAMAAYARGRAADPLVAHTVTGPGTPLRRSDVQSRLAARAMAVYHDVYRPLGAEHQLAMAFPAGRTAGAPRRICVVVNRGIGDFGDADVATAALLRVRLARAMGRLAETAPAAACPDGERPAVTRREAAVLNLLAFGLTNEQIAHRLAISPRTVGKHLEHAYPKLAVNGRVGAANAWRAATAGR